MTVLLPPVFFVIFIVLLLAVFLGASRADEHAGDQEI